LEFFSYLIHRNSAPEPPDETDHIELNIAVECSALPVQ